MSPTPIDDTLARALESEVAKLGLQEPEPEAPPESIATLRRRRGSVPGSALATVSLVRIDGVLRWTYQRPPRAVGSRRARRASAPVGAGQVFSFGFQEVPPNKIVDGLEKLDAKLTPARGLRRFKNGVLTPVKAPDPTPRALLFIHGTFSKCDGLFTELQSSPEGKAFLAAAEARYSQVLAFDHPTLSVSPIMNALDLERALGGYAGEIDVICHSRGGLVTAWWLCLVARKVRRVVFVASPLEGTSLAAPARLKHTLDTLANIADATEKTAKVVGTFVPPAGPLLGVAAGLMQVLGGGLSLAASSPLLDAGVAVVAGLASQSRVRNNQELLRLHEVRWATTPEFYAVRSNFEPGDPNAPCWQFWKKLRRPLTTLADMAADAVFDGPNDLVVDGSSMTRLLGNEFAIKQVHDFGTNDRMHHTNYFAQPETAKFMTKSLL